jgi:hypothetical protein
LTCYTETNIYIQINTQPNAFLEGDLYKFYSSPNIIKMSRARLRDKNSLRMSSENLQARDQVGKLGADKRIILK